MVRLKFSCIKNRLNEILYPSETTSSFLACHSIMQFGGKPTFRLKRKHLLNTCLLIMLLFFCKIFTIFKKDNPKTTKINKAKKKTTEHTQKTNPDQRT